MILDAKISTIIALSIPTAALPSIHIEIYCFTSGNKHPIQLELREYTDTTIPLSYAFAKYRQSKTWMQLITKSATSSAATPGAPDENTITWIELLDAKPSGSYEMVSQGTTIISMQYKSFSTHETYGFIRDTGIEFSPEKGCVWTDR